MRTLITVTCILCRFEAFLTYRYSYIQEKWHILFKKAKYVLCFYLLLLKMYTHT